MSDQILDSVFNLTQVNCDVLFKDIKIAGPPKTITNLDDCDYLGTSEFIADSEWALDSHDNLVRIFRGLIYDMAQTLKQATRPIQFFKMYTTGGIDIISKVLEEPGGLYQVRLTLAYNGLRQGYECGIVLVVEKGAVPERIIA